MPNKTIEMVPAWKRPKLSERHLYWVVIAVQLGIILIQWRAFL